MILNTDSKWQPNQNQFHRQVHIFSNQLQNSGFRIGKSSVKLSHRTWWFVQQSSCCTGQNRIHFVIFTADILQQHTESRVHNGKRSHCVGSGRSLFHYVIQNSVYKTFRGINEFLTEYLDHCTHCVRLSLPVSWANCVARMPLYRPAVPPMAAPIITDDPICENANSKRPLCRDAPSGNMNSGWACCRNLGS